MSDYFLRKHLENMVEGSAALYKYDASASKKQIILQNLQERLKGTAYTLKADQVDHFFDKKIVNFSSEFTLTPAEVSQFFEVTKPVLAAARSQNASQPNVLKSQATAAMSQQRLKSMMEKQRLPHYLEVDQEGSLTAEEKEAAPSKKM